VLDALVDSEPAAGSGSKVICTVNDGLFGEHCCDEPDELVPAPLDFEEFFKLTALTPSIKRRRCSVSATSDWLLAQPPSVIVGTLPTGVAEPLALAVEEAAAVDPEAPTVPSSEEIDASCGSTRPSSWKA
jgi:hypothetical protein